MSPKVFITGVTGYIGGDTLYALYQKHSDYEISALIRTQDKADIVTKAYPKIRTVLGGLDDYDLIKEEASKADVVIHTADASDHQGAAKAIAAGLAAGHSKERPGYWLHTGGTGILTWEDSKHKRLGEHSDKEYNDWSGVTELTSLSDEAFHRNVDKIVLEAGSGNGDSTKTVIVCPPTIHGKGRGPCNQRGRQAYELAKFVVTKQWVPIIGGGKARWNNVHVHDLADAFVLLTEAAVQGNTDKDIWGQKGYMIIENGEHVWSDIATKMGQEAHSQGYIKNKPEEKALSSDEAQKEAGFEALSWGLNSRAKAERLYKTLGWKASRHDLTAELGQIIRDEHDRISKAA